MTGEPLAGRAENRQAGEANVASYRIEASYDPATHRIAGTETITYRNASADTLTDLWFHLYLNAFQSRETLWLREAGIAHRGSSFDPENPGWIMVDRVAFSGTETTATLEPSDPDSTIAGLPLPEPLPPGETTQVDLAWTAQLPRVFARTGFYEDFVLAGQWYPKLAVYDRGSWDTEPWHANAEFFADFGDYDLTLTVPDEYIVGATGVRAAEDNNADGTKSVRYEARSVTDVAWTAWPNFVRTRREIVAAGQPVTVELLAPPGQESVTERQFRVAAASLDAFGRWYGAYPWPQLTVVVPPASAEGAGGMEYPMLVTSALSPGLPFDWDESIRMPEVVTIHEIAHQWFPMQVQTNEAREAWLDEGFADYSTIRLLDELYGGERSQLDLPFGRLGYAEVHRAVFLATSIREPLSQPAWNFATLDAYAGVVYSKGSLALLTLEGIFGSERFTAALRGYVERWRWGHPTSRDLQATLEAELGESLDWFFDAVVFGSDAVEYQLSSEGGGPPVVRRLGEGEFPVEIAVAGSTAPEIIHWSGDSSDLVLPAPIGSAGTVAIDPAGHLALEVDRMNNRYDAAPDVTGPAALAGRWLSFVQLVLQLTGYLG